MKKLFIICLSLFSLNIMAQSKFIKVHQEGDELLGTASYDMYFIHNFTITKDANGKIMAWVKAPEDSFFDEDFLTITIGIYNTKDSLIQKLDWECHTSKDMSNTYLYAQSHQYTHIHRHISNLNSCDCSTNSFKIDDLWTIITEKYGYIRIHASAYSGYTDEKAYTYTFSEWLKSNPQK